MKFRLTCTSGKENDMAEYVRDIRAHNIVVTAKQTLDTKGKPHNEYSVYLFSLESLIELQKAVGSELIIGPFDHPDRIEIYDGYRE